MLFFQTFNIQSHHCHQLYRDFTHFILSFHSFFIIFTVSEQTNVHEDNSHACFLFRFQACLVLPLFFSITFSYALFFLAFFFSVSLFSPSLFVSCFCLLVFISCKRENMNTTIGYIHTQLLDDDDDVFLNCIDSWKSFSLFLRETERATRISNVLFTRCIKNIPFI